MIFRRTRRTARHAVRNERVREDDNRRAKAKSRHNRADQRTCCLRRLDATYGRVFTGFDFLLPLRNQLSHVLREGQTCIISPLPTVQWFKCHHPLCDDQLYFSIGVVRQIHVKIQNCTGTRQPSQIETITATRMHHDARCSEANRDMEAWIPRYMSGTLKVPPGHTIRMARECLNADGGSGGKGNLFHDRHWHRDPQLNQDISDHHSL